MLDESAAKMDKDKVRRFGWAIYLSLASTGVIFALIALFLNTGNPFTGLLTSIAANVLTVSGVFFLVDKFFKWNPEEERKEREAVLREQRLERILERAIGVYYLRGPTEIYNSALRLYSSVEQQVRVFQIAGGPRPPDDYAEATAKILQERKQAGRPVTFEAYLLLNLKKVPSNFKESNENRLGLYGKYGVRDLVSLHLLDSASPIGFDVWIVDRKHAHISLTTLAGVDQLQCAIVLENQPQIVSDIADWFEKRVRPLAVPYETWLGNQSE